MTRVAPKPQQDRRVRCLSLFSGADGLGAGLTRAGVNLVAGCEKDRWARAVWRRHHPDLPICHDVEDLDDDWLTAHAVGRVDILAGGSPCTDLSLAGRRRGLAGDESRLFWHQCRIADLCAAPWVVWENVPDVLSSHDGVDFAAVLWGLTGHHPAVPEDGWRSCGVCYGDRHVVVWRVLDAQWFGVAQRRRRLFAVRGPRAVAGRVVGVLLDAEGLSGGPAPRRHPQPAAAEPSAGGAGAGGVQCVSENQRGEFLLNDLPGALGGPGGKLGQGNPVVVGPLMAHHQRLDDAEVAGHQLVVGALTASHRGLPGCSEARTQLLPITFAHQVGGRRETMIHDQPGRARALISSQTLAVLADTVVRRLTPVERERLMGWPDGWTATGIDDDGREVVVSNTQRTKLTGNGVVAPVAEWLGRRIIEAAA